MQDSLAVRGARPVEWLFDHADVDARWCLVHATHLTGDETQRLARSGAVAGLCPVTEANLALLAQKVEEAVRQTGVSQLDTNEIGLAILGPLRELDEVAYLRFASVYRAFESADDFIKEIDSLRADRQLTQTG